MTAGSITGSVTGNVCAPVAGGSAGSGITAFGNIVFQDTFNRADGDLVGGNGWTGDAGRFTINANDLDVAGSASQRRAYNLGSGIASGILAITIESMTGTDAVGVIFNSNGTAEWYTLISSNGAANLFERPFGSGSNRGNIPATTVTYPYTFYTRFAGDFIQFATTLGQDATLDDSAANGGSGRSYKTQTEIGLTCFGSATLSNVTLYDGTDPIVL